VGNKLINIAIEPAQVGPAQMVPNSDFLRPIATTLAIITQLTQNANGFCVVFGMKFLSTCYLQFFACLSAYFLFIGQIFPFPNNI
jgi:hypothetical protein